MFHPRVSGIIATDIKGNICNQHGRPVLQGTKFESLDRAILKEYLRNHTKENGRAIFVTGSNNYTQMAGLLKDSFFNCPIIISSEENIGMMKDNEMHLIETTNGDRKATQSALFNAAFAKAYEMRSHIYVLGGRAVYQTFTKHYSHFIHVRCMHDIEGAYNRVNVTFDGLHEPESPHLITRDMNIPQYRIIDNGYIKVIEHNVWEH